MWLFESKLGTDYKSAPGGCPTPSPTKTTNSQFKTILNSIAMPDKQPD